MAQSTSPSLTSLGYNVLLNIFTKVYHDEPRERVRLPWRGELPCEGEERLLFPGPPPKLLLELSSMHSALSKATIPLIWREVAVLFGSDNDLEFYKRRLEIATKPHIAPHVRALFVSYAWFGNDENNNALIVATLPKFIGLRAICLGGFQGYFQFNPDQRLAKVIREHPHIDTILLSRMKEASHLIAPGEDSRSWRIDLENCHYGTGALIANPKRIHTLTHEQCEPQEGMKKWIRDDIWATLTHLDLGDGSDFSMTNEGAFLHSLKAYRANHPIENIGLRELCFGRYVELGQWMAATVGLPLTFLRLMSYEGVTKDALATFARRFPKLKKLELQFPSADQFEEEGEGEDDEMPFLVDQDLIDELSGFQYLERVILHIPTKEDYPYDPFDDDSDGDIDLVDILANVCSNLKTAQLHFKGEEIEGYPDTGFATPEVADYEIQRGARPYQISVSRYTANLLDGTVLDFLEA